MADVAVMLVHGMGDPAGTFAERLRKKIVTKLGKRLASRVAFGTCYWAFSTHDQQSRLWGRIAAHVKGSTLRKDIAVQGFGDALAFATAGGFRSAIEAAVLERVSELRRTAKLSLTTPLVVAAHSLGGHIIEQTVLGLQRGRLSAHGAFDRFETLRGLVTFGCNIPLFASAWRESELDTFEPPGGFEWVNLYHRWDPLGFPLARAYPEVYGHVRDSAHGTAIGPGLAHTGYWTRPVVAGAVANQIERVLR